MQVLWSRAQARAACRCGSCLHAAIARRTTTAAGRRRLKISDVFTACYSTILATAAFADAKVKEDRRKEWDRVIAEAKAGVPGNELEDVEGTYSQPMSNSQGPILNSAENLQATVLLEPALGVPDVWMAPPRIQETPLGNKLSLLDSQLKNIPILSASIYKQKTVDLRTSDSDPIDDMVGEHQDPELLPREPRKELHLRKMEEMIVKLVDRLLLQTSMFSVESSVVLGANDVREQMNDIAERIEALRTGFTHLPSYSWADRESVEEQRSALHRLLSVLCHGTTPSKPSVDLMLAKICYNLLISTAPPSIFTYNTLLREFNRLRQPHLTQIVVDSYFYESRFKINSTTGRLILDHYRIKQDPKGFNTIIKRMGGHDKSMRIERRHTSLLWKESAKEWALANKVIHRGSFIYQKMPRGADVFDSLICGSLEMKSVRCAIRYVRAAFREGSEVTSETLCNVIKKCLAEVDRLAGISLLRAILCWTVHCDVSATFYTKTIRSLLYRLVSLCGMDPFLGSRQYLPLSIPGDLLEQMLRHMRIESLTETVERLVIRISSINNVFRDTELQLSDLDRVRTAIELLERADGWDRKHARRQRKHIVEGRWIRLRSLESRLGSHAKKMDVLQIELLPLAFATLSTEQKNQYLKSIKLVEPEKSERLELLVRFARIQSRGQSRKVESLPDNLLAATSKKILIAEEKVQPQQPFLLVPIYPVNKAELRAAAL
jgi:hypothetical protein